MNYPSNKYGDGMIDDETQAKINLIRVNEAKFQAWFDYIQTDQVGRVKTQIDATQSDSDKRQLELVQKKKMLNEQFSKFEQLSENASRQISNMERVNQDKKNSLQDAEDKRDTIQDQFNQLEDKIREIKSSNLKIGMDYKVSGELTKYETLDDPLLIIFFKCLSFVLYDDEIFDWAEFQKKSFQIKKLKQTTSSVSQSDSISIQLGDVKFSTLSQEKVNSIQQCVNEPGLVSTTTYKSNLLKIQSIHQCLLNVQIGYSLEKEKESREIELKDAYSNVKLMKDQIKEDDEQLMLNLWEQQMEYNKTMAQKVRLVLDQINIVLTSFMKSKDVIQQQAKKFDTILLQLSNSLKVDNNTYVQTK